jgi:hypothetical protein
VSAGSAQAAPILSTDTPERILFPIVGPAQWSDDFGAPRAQGGHEGNDVLSDWRAPVVAVEAGRVQIHNGSERAGCMLYLHGKSGTTYLYIHLNNDLTPKNDGKGGCKPGVAFAPGLEDGAKVRAGELLGYVGSSGDAGATNHLHFELHPDDGGAVSPYRWLKKAEPLLHVLSGTEQSEARATAEAVTMTLSGTFVSAEEAELPPEEPLEPETPPEAAPPDEAPVAETPEPEQPVQTLEPVIIGGSSRVPAAAGTLVTIRVTSVELSTGVSFSVERAVTLAVPAEAVIERRKGARTRPAKLDGAEAGERVTITTGPAELSLKTQLARPGTLAVSRLVLAGPES